MILPPESSTKKRVAVVGGGIIGLCLAEALAERGASFCCFERGVVGGGQSGGVTRIFRHRHERSELVELALRARASWTGLESRLGERLVGEEGVLILTPDANEGARLERLGALVETVSWDAASNQMPLGLAGGEVPHAVFETGGGAIRARSAINSLHQVVAGSVINADVQGIARHGSGVTIFASDGIYEVDEVFVTAGTSTAPLAWTEGIEIPEQRAWSLRLTFESRASSPLPCLLDRSGSFGEVAYGSPTPDGRGYAIGLSGSDGSIAAPNTEAPDPKRLTEIRSRTETYAQRLMPNALGPLTGARQCLATPLRSGDDDFHTWRSGRVTYFAGHNLFKFAPLIGALLADSIGGRDLPGELRLNPPQQQA